MTANSTYKPSEGKREEFRRYLEKTGVMDALTKVFVQLYEENEKPDNALLFIQNAIAKHLGQETCEELSDKCTELQKKLAEMESQMAAVTLTDSESREVANPEPAEEQPAEPAAETDAPAAAATD